MSHKRTLIRQAAVTKLSGATAAGTRVYSNVSLPLDELELPAINLYTLSESSEEFNVGPPRLRRNLKLACEITAEANSSLDDTLDSIAYAVEQLLQGQDR